MPATPDVRKAHYYVAVVSKENINQKERIKEYELVDALGKPIYAIIEQGLNWDNLKHLPWKKVYYFINPIDIPTILQVISFEFTGGGFNA